MKLLLKSKLQTALVTALLTLGLLGNAGCATTERGAYVSIGTLGATANAAIGAYQSFVQEHGASPEDTATARHYVQVYVEAMETARHVVEAFKRGTARRAAVTQAMDELEARSGQLVVILGDLSNPAP